MFGSKKKKAANLVENGATAVGTITAVRDTGMTINDNPRVEMIFRIDPLDGSPAFEASKKSTVSRVRIPQPGQRYPVFYDRADPQTFAFIESLADESGRALILQKFGDAFGPDAAGIGQIAVTAASTTAAGDPVAQIERLAALHASGALTDAEFAEQKQRLLAAM